MENCTVVDKCRKECESIQGRFYPKDGKCYHYKVLKRLCVKVDAIYAEDFSSDAFVLDGGCYENDEVGYYVPANPDKLYKFDYVPVEIRSKYDPYTVLTETNYNLGSKGSSKLRNLAYILVIISGVCAILTLFAYLRSRGENQGGSKTLLK